MDHDGSRQPAGSSLGWDRADHLLFSWLGQPEPQLHDRLQELRRQDPELADRVAERLQRLQRSGFEIRPTGPETGADFGDYRIVSRLGAGGMGAVYLARQQSLDRAVALKVIRSDRLQDPAARERFRREARAVANLRHPGICAVLEVGEVDGAPFLAMQYVEGETLANRLAAQRAARTATPGSGTHATGPTTQREIHAALALVEQVAEALHAAHEAGVVHRDVKPANIMVDGQGRPVLLDFGLAHEEHGDGADAALTVTGELLGTPAYMSPEQIRPRAVVDRRTDVYALAVTLFECLTLQRPFTASNQLELYERIERDPTPDPRRSNPNLPADISAVLAMAMEKEPARRYATARDFADELRRIREREPVKARRIGAAQRLWRWSRRNPVGASLVLVLGTSAITTAILLRDRTDQLATIESTSAALQTRQDEFDMLSLVPLLARAREREADLRSARPEHAPEMHRWLREHVEPLREARPKLQTTIDSMKRRALPRTEAEIERDRRENPSYTAWLRQRSRLAASIRARAIRAGEAEFQAPMPELGDIAENPVLLNQYAWSRVAPDDDMIVFGEEAAALVVARRATELLERRLSERPPPADNPQLLLQLQDWSARCLDTLAWAAAANGLDDEALAAETRAASVAPDSTTETYRQSLQSLQEHIARLRAQPDEREASLRDSVRALEATVGERSTYAFASPADEFLFETLTHTATDLDAFLAEVVPAIETRLAWAERVRELTVDRHVERWERARTAIARADGATASVLYRSEPPFDLRPQVGLIPLGMNPRTGLWEFYHLRSAWDPRGDVDAADLRLPTHDPETGSIRVDESTGIILVLVPAGSFLMGAQPKDPNDPNYCETASNSEWPPHPVTLDAFFLARHEVTMAQWARIADGETPSEDAEAGPPLQPFRPTRSNPVDSVTWRRAAQVLGACDLVLPTEAQWECACRAGTTTPWSSGPDAASLDGRENLFDRTAAKVMQARARELGATAPFDDQWLFPAPVGWFAANPWGFHDMHGNVLEWCQDRFEFYTLAKPRLGDGLREQARLAGDSTNAAGDYVVRGGATHNLPKDATSSTRTHETIEFKVSALGLRAARLLDR